MAVVSIYKFYNNGYSIFGHFKSVSGFWLGAEPFFRIQETEINVDLIANAIKTSFRTDDGRRVPDPKDWREFNKIFGQKAGVKSSREFDKPTTLLLQARTDESHIILSSTRPAAKPDKGFAATNTENVTIAITASNQEIMEACELAFSKCGK